MMLQIYTVKQRKSATIQETIFDNWLPMYFRTASL